MAGIEGEALDALEPAANYLEAPRHHGHYGLPVTVQQNTLTVLLSRPFRSDESKPAIAFFPVVGIRLQ
jgi:hypothetical protein